MDCWIESMVIRDSSVIPHPPLMLMCHKVDGANLRPTNLFNYDPEEDESLGTFGQATTNGNEQPAFNLAAQQNNLTQHNQRSTSKNDTEETDDLTHDGDQTIDTLDSRISNLENFMTSMSRNVNNVVQALKSTQAYKQEDPQEEDGHEGDSSSSSSDNGDDKDETTRPSVGNAKSGDIGSDPADPHEGSAGEP